MTTLRSSVILATLVASMSITSAHADDSNLWMNQAAGPDMLNTGGSVNALPLVSISLGEASQIVNSYSVDVTAVVSVSELLVELLSTSVDVTFAVLLSEVA